MKPPSHLSREARTWWRKIVTEFGIDDAPGYLTLQTALEAFDRMRGAQEAIERDGATVRDRFDQAKPHPMCAVERDARAQLIQGLKALNLDAEPIGDIGRPAGR